MTCIPLGDGAVACMRGTQLTDVDRQAIDDFRRTLHDLHKEETVTEPTQPDPTPAPQPAGVDLAAAGVDGWLFILKQVEAKREELNGVEQQAKAAIQDALGEEVDGLIDGVPVVRWSHVAGSRKFNRKDFAKAYPQLDEQYTVVGSPGRRFEVIKPKAVK